MRGKFLDLTGQTFGDLTPLSFENRKGRIWWKCNCACGNTLFIPSWNLRGKKQTKCRKCRYPDLTGKQFGEWKVLKFIRSVNSQQMWECRCSCGYIAEVQTNNLRMGHSTKCWNCRNRLLSKIPEFKESCQVGFRQWYNRYYQGAVTRGLSWELTPDQFQLMSESACYYCGEAPERRSFSSNKPIPHFGNFSGIDRKDNNQGYTPQNSVPCCTECNFLKRDHSDWLLKIKKICKYRETQDLLSESARDHVL